jgi:hypothetical protein
MSIKHTLKLVAGLVIYDIKEWIQDYKTVRDISKNHPEISPLKTRELLEIGWMDASSEISEVLAKTGTCKKPEDLN